MMDYRLNVEETRKLNKFGYVIKEDLLVVKDEKGNYIIGNIVKDWIKLILNSEDE